MNCLRALITGAALSLALTAIAAASVVDATGAEAAYQKGDYAGARAGFEQAIAEFRDASKDSLDTEVYREAAYLYDRLADCCFTQRDWDGVKLYVDGLLVVGYSERNLAESRLAGALESGIAYASARYLSQRLDEAVRLASLVQLKRSLGLILFDSRGQGAAGEGAIKQYQELAALWRQVLPLEQGQYMLDINKLNAKVDAFDKIYTEMAKLTSIEALWDKYPPEGRQKTDAESKPAEATPDGKKPAKKK